MTWPLVPLGEVLDPITRPEVIDPQKEYRLLGAHWYAKGLYIKDTKPGSAIRASSVYRVETGDFVYNRLFAWMGSFAVAGPEVHECYVSNEFPCFRINQERAVGGYLWHYFSRQSAWAEALGLSSGGTPTSRNRLKEEKLLGIKIPLPPVPEQQRVVARVEAIASRVAEARRLRDVAVEDAQRLCRAILRDTSLGAPTPTPMRELVQQREQDVRVERDKDYHFAGVYCFGRGVFRGQKKKGLEFSYDRLTTLQAGDFVYPKLMAWEGALGVVPPECHGLVVSTEFPVFEIDTNRVLPEVLDVFFRDPEVWPQLSSQSTGTNVRRQRLNPSEFLAYQFPLPARQIQERLRQVTASLNKLRPLHAETAAELDALLPSVLDRAFAGEL